MIQVLFKISSTQSKIVYILVKNRGNVVTFNTLSTYVYENKDHNMHTISSHIRDIRNIIGDNIIKNTRGIGYKIDL